MIFHLKETLENYPDDQLVVENALDLFSKASKIQGAKGIPVDWSIPEEIKQLKLQLRTTLSRGKFFHKMRIVINSTIKNLFITAYNFLKNILNIY